MKYDTTNRKGCHSVMPEFELNYGLLKGSISHLSAKSLFFTESGFMTLAYVRVLVLEIQSRFHLKHLISGLHNM